MSRRFCVVDLETTGLDPTRDRILQMAAVTTEIDVDADGQVNSTIIDRWSSYVRMRYCLGRIGGAEIHGIRRRDLWRAPRLADALGELRRRVDGSTVCAHNAAFDGAFLVAAATEHACDLGFDEMLCTLTMSRRLDPGRTRSHRLGDLCRVYGITLDDAHDALADAEATAALLDHLFTAHDIVDPVHVTTNHRLRRSNDQPA